MNSPSSLSSKLNRQSALCIEQAHQMRSGARAGPKIDRPTCTAAWLKNGASSVEIVKPAQITAVPKPNGRASAMWSAFMMFLSGSKPASLALLWGTCSDDPGTCGEALGVEGAVCG